MTATGMIDDELENEGRYLQVVMEELDEAIDALQSYQRIGREMQDSPTPVSRSSVALVRCSVSQAGSRIGLAPLETISTENIDSGTLTITLASISEGIKKAWEAIKAALKKFWEWVKSFTAKLFGYPTDIEEKAKETLLMLEDNSKQWGDVPDASEKPEYPYSSLRMNDAMALMVDGKYSPNWARDIPPLYAQFMSWAPKTAKVILAREEALIAVWESTLRDTNRDWSKFDALLIKTREEYRTMYGQAPSLPGGVRVRPSREKITTVDDITVTTAHMTMETASNHLGENLGAKIRKVSQGDMANTLTAVIDILSKEADIDAVQAELKQYQDRAEKRFYTVINERGYPEDADLADKSLDWQQAQKRFNFINGREVKTMLTIWSGGFQSLVAYIHVVQKISKMHLK